MKTENRKVGTKISSRRKLKKKLTILKYQKDRNICIYISPTFSHVANTYQIGHESNRAIRENVETRKCVLERWLKIH